MRVSKIRIRNIIGIESLDLTPGTVTRIEGPNGVGKSSIITALKALVKGGKQVEIVRDNKPADEPAEVGILIEDEGGQIAINKRITPSGSTPVVKVAGATQKEPQRVIDSLMDSLAVNPIDFLKAKPADQVKWLLSAMPFEITAEEFMKAGIDTTGWSIPPGQHGLETIRQVYDFLYESRRDANVEARKAGETAERLRDSLPEGSDAEIVADRDRLWAERDAIKGSMASYREKVKTAEAEAIKQLTDEAQLKIDAKASEIGDIISQISDLKQKLAIAQREQEDIKKDRDQEIRNTRAEAAAPQKTERELNDKLSAVNNELSLLDQRITAFQRAAGLRDEYERTSKQAAAAKEQWANLDAMLKRLEIMKTEVLSKSPIPGVEIKGDEIWYKGHSLATQNEAKRIILALKVCAARVEGKVPLICLDGAEALDPQTYEAIDDFAEAEGIQMIVTRVTGDEGLIIK